MGKNYRVKLSVLLNSVSYGSDVESDGYYVVKDTNEIIEYGEDLSDSFMDKDDKIYEFLLSDKCLQLPTVHDLIKSAPDLHRDITLKYIDEIIEDEKQKKILTKAYKSKFCNRIVPSIPGSSKFNKEIRKLGRTVEWNEFIWEVYGVYELEFVRKWCDEHNVEIIYDE